MDKSFALAVRVIKLSLFLKNTYKEYDLSRQLIRSGTSIAANIREAYRAESDADFIHKLAIAQKETEETMLWIELLLATEFINDSQFQSIHNDTNEVQ